MTQFNVTSALEDSGEVRVGVEIGPEQMGVLESLHTANNWQLYRDILIQQKAEFMNAVLPMDDPYKVMKQVGMVAGLNFCINQLPILVAEHNKRLDKNVKQAEAKDQKRAKGFKRG